MEYKLVTSFGIQWYTINDFLVAVNNISKKYIYDDQAYKISLNICDYLIKFWRTLALLYFIQKYRIWEIRGMLSLYTFNINFKIADCFSKVWTRDTVAYGPVWV